MEQNTCNKCGRPMQYATEPKCNYCDACMNEYCGCKLGRIKEVEPTCDSTAVIPSITVESVEGITNLANCLVHVTNTNTTYYVDDKHRIMITWAGPVNIPGYDMEGNPNHYKDQIVTDTEAGIAVIYDKNGVGFTFGIEQNADFEEAVSSAVSTVLERMVEDGTLENIINEEVFNDINSRVESNTTRIGVISRNQNEDEAAIDDLENRVLRNTIDISDLSSDQVQNVKKSEANSVSMGMLTQEVREAMTGGSTPVVGEDSVGNENIQDGAITILKLEQNLRNNFDIQMETVELGEGQPGFYQVVGDAAGGILTFNLPENNINQCFAYNLEKGKTYRYTGYNYSLTHGLVIGTAVGSPAISLSPSFGKLNLDIYSNPQNDIYGTDMIFTVNEDDLVAFITKFTDAAIANNSKCSLLKDYGTLYEISDITPYDRTVARDSWETLVPDYTYNKYYMQFVRSTVDTPINRNPYSLNYIDNTNYTIRLYKIYKNHTYRASGTQRYGNSGFALYDNACKLVYVSQTVEQSSITQFEYEFTATSDGFAITQDQNTTTLRAMLQEAVAPTSENNRISGKTIAYNGDSITESRLNESLTTYNGGAYPKIIADITDSSYANFAKGGATLAYETIGQYHICRDIVNMTGDYDAIVFSGGINDYWKNVPLGTYSESDYTSAVDDTTVCGALESIFRQAINTWCGKPIMFVITHKIGGTAFTPNTAGYTFDDLYKKIVGICNKYSIPYYDCYKHGGLNSYMDIMNTTFMTAGASGHPDHTHPNEAAYKKYYVPQIIKMLEENFAY